MTDVKTITFLTTAYTQAGLAAMTDPELLTLRNLVATNLGVASIKAFKDHEAAVDQTWKALERFETTAAAEAGEAGAPAAAAGKPAKAPKEPKAPKPPKEPKDRKPAKSSMPQLVKRPTRKMFATIAKIGEHNGTDHGRAHRWPNYKDGMSIVDIIENDGTEPWDVYNWQSKGILSVTEATDVEYTERRAAWYKKHNLSDPDLSKETKKAEREAAKVKREAETKAKAEAKAAEVAAKAAAKAAAPVTPAPATAA